MKGLGMQSGDVHSSSTTREAWLFLGVLTFICTLRPSPYFIARRLFQLAASIWNSLLCSVSIGVLIWLRQRQDGSREDNPTCTFASAARSSFLPCMPALLCSVLVFFWDGPPVNFTEQLHMIGGVDWRVWLAYTAYASTQRPNNGLRTANAGVSQNSWVYLFFPAFIYWQMNAFILPLCWDFVLADMLPRLVMVLHLSRWEHWRGKLLAACALVALLRLNVHHCNHRIVSDTPTASPESHLQRSTQLSQSSCNKLKEGGCDETSCLPEDKSSWWHGSSKECWSPDLCFEGQMLHRIKHGQGHVSKLHHISNLSATWRNGFVTDARLANSGHRGNSSRWLCGFCISGHCPPSRIKLQPPTTKRKGKLLLSQWTEKDVMQWLLSVNISKDVAVEFVRQGISGKELLLPQLYDEEFLMTLGVSAGKSVHLVRAILELINTHYTHQKELQALVITMNNGACTVSSDCYFFGNVYPQVKNSLLLSLGMPAKSWLLESVWHVLDMLERMNWESHAAHTLILARPQPNTQLALLNHWSEMFHSTWPSGLLNEDEILPAMGVDSMLLHCFLQHFDGHTWSANSLNRYFLLLMDLDGNLAIDFTEYVLFLQAHTHFYPLVRRSQHQQLLAQLWPTASTLAREHALFHALRLAREQALFGKAACTCTKLPMPINHQLEKLWQEALESKKDSSIYYGYDELHVSQDNNI